MTVGKNEQDELAEIDALSQQLEDQMFEWHLDGDCTLLDDRCCARGWGEMRKEWPQIVSAAELLWGQDWWSRIPKLQRTLLGALMLAAGQSQAQISLAADRGASVVLAGLEQEKVKVIKRARAG